MTFSSQARGNQITEVVVSGTSRSVRSCRFAHRRILCMGKNLLPEAAACELQDCQAGASAGEASSKISARAETLRTTPHQLQSKLGKTEPKPSFEGGRLNRIGKPQNGQRGCGASASMRRAIGLSG